MTTIYSEAVKCPYCNTKVEITHLGSTNAFGAMDLDTRPPEMQRSTILIEIKLFFYSFFGDYGVTDTA